MTEPARVQQQAEVVDFDEWRFAGVSAEERNVILQRRAAAAMSREALSWSGLDWINQTDKRDAIRIYSKVALTPIILHGVRADGTCTCWRGASCPAKHRGKHPVTKDWESTPFDLEAADAMLLEEPLRNIGLRMGRQRDGRFLIAVDVDGERGLLQELEAEHGAFPETLESRSGSGGSHLLYYLTAGVEMGNRVGVVPHVDVRGRGGQVVVAPSTHYSGRRYRWTRIQEPVVLP